MNCRVRKARRVRRPAVLALLIVCLVSSFACASGGSAATPRLPQARVPVWPCRLVVKPTLLGVVADGWERSATLRRQCRELALAKAVVELEWGYLDSQSRAITRMGVDAEGVLVARVSVPPVSEALELIVHELEHLLEKTSGLDYAGEAERPGSGVWRAFGGFETQRAIDAGRQLRRELRDNPPPRR